MRVNESLRRQWERRNALVRFHAAVEINDTGLVFGAGTILANMREDWLGTQLDIEADGERSLALLAIVQRRGVSLEAIAHIKAASDYWLRGDKALANIRLAHARLPRFDDRGDAYRLFLADTVLADGVSPRDLLRELGIDPSPLDLLKYDPAQPRVPAGSGRASGRWGPGVSEGRSGDDGRARGAVASTAAAAIGVAARPAADIAERFAGTLLGPLSAQALEGLAAFAARFTVPTSIFGAIFIPTSNDGGVTQGVLPGHPEVSFRDDGPAGTVTFTVTGANGSALVVTALNRGGVYVDADTGEPIGRRLDDALYFDLKQIEAMVAGWRSARDDALSETDTSVDKDEPSLCPKPTSDRKGGRMFFDLLYQEYVDSIVNKGAPPISPYLGYTLKNPVTGRDVSFDICIKSTGKMVDAKGNYNDLLSFYKARNKLEKSWLDQAQRQLQASGGRGLEWHFHDQAALDFAREIFAGKISEKDIQLILTPYPGGVPKPNPRVN